MGRPFRDFPFTRLTVIGVPAIETRPDREKGERILSFSLTEIASPLQCFWRQHLKMGAIGILLAVGGPDVSMVWGSG